MAQSAHPTLDAALHFYGISLRYALTPQAKGKVEREHQFWQRRRVWLRLLHRRGTNFQQRRPDPQDRWVNATVFSSTVLNHTGTIKV